MIAVPQHGFVFLAMTKCASTALELELAPFGQVITRKSPELKHMNYRGFERFIQPLLDRAGCTRHSYEVVCLFREPIGWLHSWWRYRSRPQLARPDAPRNRNYTGNVTFEQFCNAYVTRSETYAATVGRQAEFIRGHNDQVSVDKIFRYEDLPAFVDYLSDKLDRRIRLDTVNVSPRNDIVLPAQTQAALRGYLTPEYEIYERRTVGAAKSTTTTG